MGPILSAHCKLIKTDSTQTTTNASAFLRLCPENSCVYRFNVCLNNIQNTEPQSFFLRFVTRSKRLTLRRNLALNVSICF